MDYFLWDIHEIPGQVKKKKKYLKGWSESHK